MGHAADDVSLGLASLRHRIQQVGAAGIVRREKNSCHRLGRVVQAGEPGAVLTDLAEGGDQILDDRVRELEDADTEPVHHPVLKAGARRELVVDAQRVEVAGEAGEGVGVLAGNRLGRAVPVADAQPRQGVRRRRAGDLGSAGCEGSVDIGQAISLRSNQLGTVCGLFVRVGILRFPAQELVLRDFHVFLLVDVDRLVAR